MNLPALLRRSTSVGIEDPIVCSNINKIGFRMCGGASAYEDGAARAPVPRGRDVGLRLRARSRRARRSSGSARSRTSSRSSSAPRAGEHREHPGARSPSTGVSSAEHAAGRIHRRAPEAAAPAAPAARRGRGPVSLGDLRHAAEPLAARGRGASTSSTSSAAAIPVNLAAQPPGRAPDPRRPRDRDGGQHRVLDGPAVLRPRARPRAATCHYIESAARSEGPSVTGRAMQPHPRRLALRAVPGLGRERLALPRLGVRLVRARPEWPARIGADRIRGRRDAGHLPRTTGSRGSIRRLLEILPLESRSCGRPATRTPRGLGIDGH